jgi:aspartate aminotransferase-like enzyme
MQGGQGHLSDRMLRIGHMGWVSAPELERVIEGLDDVANVLGIQRTIPESTIPA